MRVKTWRRLQQLGAVAIRNAVYVLPDSAQAREDFEWMKAQIVASQGDASVFAADTVDSLTHDEIVAAFRADRARLFEAVRDDVRVLRRKAAETGAMKGTDLRRLQRCVRQVRDRFAQVAATDFFAAGGREEAHRALTELEQLAAGPGAAQAAPSARGAALRSQDYRGRTWVTRPRPGVDRSGSAWLVRRFIDPAARFAFADKPDALSKAVPFDMYDVEFSHRGDRCTFEVLLERFGITDRAVAQLGRLVHDLDLKEHRFNVPEAPAIGRLIDGLRQVFQRDEELLEHGVVIFEALYRAYSTAAPGVVDGRGRRSPTRAKKGR
ncbi:MAG TPA: chromate resistance protein ChrB domain-containing protein [Propionicimonas sp.]